MKRRAEMLTKELDEEETKFTKFCDILSNLNNIHGI